MTRFLQPLIVPSAPTMSVQTGATYVVDSDGKTDRTIVLNHAGTVTLTLPSAAIFPGRVIRTKTVTNNAVVSNASNVVARNALSPDSPGTSILAATAGSWADLESDGTYWVITAGS